MSRIRSAAAEMRLVCRTKYSQQIGSAARITACRGDPSMDCHPPNALDTRSSSGDLRRYRVEGPSISDMECPDPMPHPGAERLRLRVADLQPRYYLPAARFCGRR